MSETLLQVHELSKWFEGLLAVDKVTFDIHPGEVVGVIGPNGAGKSTLFNLIAGDLRPTSGRVQLVGRDITGLPSYRIARRGVGRSFQLVHLFDSMSVSDNVRVAAEDHTRLWLLSSMTALGGAPTRRDEARSRTSLALELVGIEHLAEKAVVNLSFGQQRLVGVARAVAVQPKLVLLDEPAAGLSRPEIVNLEAAIVRIRTRGTAVLLVEHNIEFVLKVCDRIIVLNFGAQIAAGTPAEIRSNSAVIEAYLGKRR